VTVLVSPALDGGGNALQKDQTHQHSQKEVYDLPISTVRLGVSL
jgi:hypothetical protein